MLYQPELNDGCWVALIVEHNDVQRAWVSRRWQSTFIWLIRHNTESVPLQEKVVTQEEKNIVVHKIKKEGEREKQNNIKNFCQFEEWRDFEKRLLNWETWLW